MLKHGGIIEFRFIKIINIYEFKYINKFLYIFLNPITLN